ncbi:restriction endonuclease [Haloferax namakaokahaiae]|uniref:Restriction endonuclease n=1 Tax=Haloferax namakaokahaiae TaxID=1748331 RepID=A0ABD5ZGE6_9EURY
MTRLVELGSSDFVKFLSDLWTQRNWQTNIQPRGEGRFLIQGRRADGTKGMLLALPDGDATVEKDNIRGFIAHAKKRSIDVIVVATQGEFTDEVRGFATNHDVKLLDLDSLGETVEEEGLEELVKEYTDGDVYEKAEVEFGLPFDVPEPIANALESLPLESIRERLDGLSIPKKVPTVEELKSGSPPSVRVVVVAVLLLVLALGSVAALGPMVDGLGGPAGQSGVAVSALSVAPQESADVVAHWNARTTESIAIGNSTYAAPDGQQFVVVALEVTPAGSSPVSIPQSALAFESDGVRYGYQPLAASSGLFNGGLFAPNESSVVWTVYSVPQNVSTGTVVVAEPIEDDVAFVYNESVSTEPTTESAG